MIIIRAATIDDLPFLRAIDKIGCERDGIAWIREEREALVQTFANGRQHFALLATDGPETIAGILLRETATSHPTMLPTQRELLVPRIGEDTSYIDIFDIWIHPERRRQGVATALKRGIEDECRIRNIEWIFTFQRFDNLPAIQMNEKLGYMHIGITTMWDDVPRVCFLRRVAYAAKEEDTAK